MEQPGRELTAGKCVPDLALTSEHAGVHNLIN